MRCDQKCHNRGHSPNRKSQTMQRIQQNANTLSILAYGRNQHSNHITNNLINAKTEATPISNICRPKGLTYRKLRFLLYVSTEVTDIVKGPKITETNITRSQEHRKIIIFKRTRYLSHKKCVQIFETLHICRFERIQKASSKNNDKGLR